MFDVYFAFHMKLRKLHFFWKGVARAYVATLFYALAFQCLQVDSTHHVNYRFIKTATDF